MLSGAEAESSTTEEKPALTTESILPDNREDSNTCNENGVFNGVTDEVKNLFKCNLKSDEQLKKELLKGKKLKIATLQKDYPLSWTNVNSTGNLIGKGIAFEIMETLREKFGFTYQVVTPSRNLLGDANNGIFGMLHSGEVDMAAAFLPVVPGSHNIILWGVNLIQNEYYVLMKRPKESATGSGLLAPFDTEVWLLILLSLVVVGPIMYIVMLLRVKLCRDKEMKVYPLTACVWFVYGALMKQGSTLSPINDSTRLLFATWWLFIMILTAFYTANLTAFLTLSRFTLPIEKVEDIAKLSNTWFAMEGGPVEYSVLNNEDGDLGVLKRSVNKGQGQFINTNDENRVKSLVSSGWLYLDENRKLNMFLLKDYMKKTADGLEEKNRCTYVLTTKSYLTRNLAFAYPKTSILPSLFDPILLAYVESGIIRHLADQILPEATICPLNLGSKERQLRNSDLFTTYVVVISGFSTALAVFFVEILWRKCIVKEHAKVSWPVETMVDNNGIKKKLSFSKTKGIQPKKETFNGRDYVIVTSVDGEKRLIPLRTPSALLFHYSTKY